MDSTSMIALILLIALAIVAYVLLGRWDHRQRARIGLPPASIVAADDTALTSPSLRSEQLGLVGRPDHLLRSGGQLIPVEQKPRSRRMHPSHVMQVAAQCALVHEVYGVRPRAMWLLQLDHHAAGDVGSSSAPPNRC